jgi:hypothetical protein
MSMVINLDIYYRGLAADHIQQLADRLLRLSQEAECANAHGAALHLADAATQLLDVGTEINWQRIPASHEFEIPVHPATAKVDLMV